MPYIRKRGKTWQAIVRVKGHPDVSATRPTKAEATYWAQAEEAAIRAGQRGQYPAKTFAQALDRYAQEVSAAKGSGAGVSGLTFHDARATFATLTARKTDPLTLAKILGHRDMAQLIKTYYREDEAAIAARL